MKRFVILGLILASGIQGFAQKLFSEDKATFFNEAIGVIESRGTESAKKVSYDFQAAWNGNFSSDQQEKIHNIARNMQLKGYGLNPYLWYYFTKQ